MSPIPAFLLITYYKHIFSILPFHFGNFAAGKKDALLYVEKG